MQKLLSSLLLAGTMLIAVNGCKDDSKPLAKPAPKQNVWVSANRDAVAAAEKIADQEAKENFALFFYSAAAENKVEVFHSPEILSAFNEAWEKSKVIKTRLDDGKLHVAVEYAFKFGECKIDSNFRFISSGIKEDPASAAFKAAKQEFLKLSASKILALKVSEQQTIGDLAKKNVPSLRNELALYFFRISKAIPGMPKIKCHFSSGGGYNGMKKSANWSGKLPYDLLLMDLAAILQSVNGPDIETLKKYNPELPKDELLDVSAAASDLKKTTEDDFSPERVFAAGFTALRACP